MSCPNKKYIYRYMFRKPGPKYVHLQDLIMYIVRKACNVYFPSIYTHLKGHRLFMRHSLLLDWRHFEFMPLREQVYSGQLQGVV